MKSKVFRKYLIILLLCMVIPMIIVMILLYQIMGDEILRQTRSTEERLIQECREKYDSSLQSIQQVSVTLMETFGSAGEQYFLSQKLEEKLKSLENISILQENEVIHSYYIYYLTENRMIKNGSFYDPAFFYDSQFFRFDEIKNKESCYVWKPQRLVTDDSMARETVKVVTLLRSFPIGAAEPQGYIAINVNFDRFVELFFVSQNRTYSIMSQKDGMIYSSQMDEQGNPVIEETKDLQFNVPSQIYSDWTYQVNLEEDILLEPLKPIWIWVFWIFLFGVTSCSLVSLMTSKLFYRPIEDLMNRMKTEKQRTKLNEFQQIYEKFVQNEQEKIRIEEQSKKFEPVYYEMVVRQLLLYGKHSGSTNTDENSFQHTARGYLVAAFYDYKMSTTEEMGIWSEIKELIYQSKEEIEITVRCLGTSIQKNIAAILFYSNDGSIPDWEVYEFVESIQKTLKNRKNIDVSVGVSKMVFENVHLPDAFSKALGATYFHIYQQEKKPIVVGEMEKCQAAIDCRYPFELEKCILDSIKAQKKNDVYTNLHRFFAIIRETRIHPRIVKYWVNNLRISVIAMTERLGMESPFMGESQEAYMDIEVNRYESLDDVETDFGRYVEKCMEQMKNNTEDKHRELMESIQCYILEHINSDLSLSSVADYYNISAPYLSTIFKQQTGENFVKYVIKVKMDFASHLLLETKLAVNEVAENTGYTNLNSFSNAFKKFYGLSPSQYRFQNKK